VRFSEELDLRTRKRKNSASDSSLQRELVDDFQSFDQMQPNMPSPLISPKKRRLMTLTISPHLLSLSEQPDVPGLAHSHKGPTALGFHAGSANGILEELQWQPIEDTSSFQTSNQDSSADHLVSPFLHSCYSPTLQACAFGMGHGGQTSDKPVWNLTDALDQIEEDATVHSLFDQYLLPNSFSATNSNEGAADSTK
jgi:hypothetical protein